MVSITDDQTYEPWDDSKAEQFANLKNWCGDPGCGIKNSAMPCDIGNLGNTPNVLIELCTDQTV